MAEKNNPVINQIDYKGPISLDQYDKTIDFLNTRNKELILQENKIKEFIAQLDINDKDKPYVYEKLNNLEGAKIQYLTNSPSDVFLKTNPGYGLNNYLKAAGDIYGNKVIYDMVRNNKLYNDYMTNNVYSNDKIDEDAKEYYKQNILYESEYIKDKDNKEIGIRQWTPNMRIYDTTDMKKLMDDAAKFLAEKSGKYTKIKYVDANGKEVPEGKAAELAVFYDTITGTTQYKTAADIKKTAMDMIEGDKILSDSLHREFDIAKFHGKDKGPDGIAYDFNQWLNNKMNPLALDAQYYRPQETINRSPYKLPTDSNGSRSRSGSNSYKYDPYNAYAENGVPLGNSIYKINEGSIPINRFNSLNTQLINIFKENGISVNGKKDSPLKMSDSCIRILKNKGIYESVKELVHQRNNALNEYNEFKSKINNNNDRELLDTYTKFNSNIPMQYDANNKYDKQFTTILNDIAKDADAIEYDVPDYMREYFDKYLQDNGYSIPASAKTQYGYKLSRDQFMSLGIAMNLAADYADKEANRTAWGMLPTIKGVIAAFKDNDYVKIFRHKNNNEEEVKGTRKLSFGTTKIPTIYESTTNKHDYIINNGKDLVNKYNIKDSYLIPNQTIDYYDLYHKELINGANNSADPIERAQYLNAAKAYEKDISDKIKENITHLQINDSNIALLNNNEYRDVTDTDEYIKYATLLNAAAANGLLTNIKRTAIPYYNNKTGRNESQYNVVITVPKSMENTDILKDYVGQTIKFNVTGIFPYDKEGYDRMYNTRIDGWLAESQALNLTPGAKRSISHANMTSSYGSYIRSLDNDTFEINFMGNRFVGTNKEVGVIGAISDAINEYKMNKNTKEGNDLLKLQGNTFNELAYYIIEELKNNPNVKNILKSIDAEAPELKLAETILNNK